MRRNRERMYFNTTIIALCIIIILQGRTGAEQRSGITEERNEVIDYAYIEVVGNGDINLTYKAPDKDIYVPVSKWHDGYQSGNMIWVFDGNKRYLCLSYPLYDEQMDDSFYEKMLIGIGKQDLERVYDKKHAWGSQEKEWFITNHYKTNYDKYKALDRKKAVLEKDMQNKRMLSKDSQEHELGRYVDMLRFGNSSISKDQKHETLESKQDKVVQKGHENDDLQQEKTDLLREKLQARKERLELDELEKKLDAKK